MKKKLITLLLVAIMAVSAAFAAQATFQVVNQKPSGQGVHVDLSLGVEGQFLYKTDRIREYYQYFNVIYYRDRYRTRTVDSTLYYRTGVDVRYNFDGQNSLVAGLILKHHYNFDGGFKPYIGGKFGLNSNFSDTSFLFDLSGYLFGGYEIKDKSADTGIGFDFSVGYQSSKFKSALRVYFEYPIYLMGHIDGSSQTFWFPPLCTVGAMLVVGF